MKRLPVFIETYSPLILTAANNATVMTETRKTISGSILRGVLAARYCNQQGLGKEAHRNPNFRHLFFDALRFVDAQPAMAGKRAFVLPLSLQKEKSHGGAALPQVQDLLQIALDNRKDGFKSFRGLAVETENGLQGVQVRTNLMLHMNRSEGKRRLAGKSDDGGIFNYESIDAGQSFIGSIVGTEADLTALQDGLDVTADGITCHIGRSHFTQYGQCLLRFGNMENCPSIGTDAIRERKILLRFDTSYLPVKANGTCADFGIPDGKELLQPLIEHMGNGFSLQEIYASPVEVEKFVGIWSMKQPKCFGLAAGSVFALQKYSDWTEEDLVRLGALLYEGIGMRRAEGFGQLRVWPWQSIRLADKNKNKAICEMPSIPETVKQQVEQIISRRILEQIRLYAHKDVQDMYIPAGSTHFFARLLQLLEKAKEQENGSLRTAMETSLQSLQQHNDNLVREKKDKHLVPFVERLQMVSLHNQQLKDYFTKAALQPYEELHNIMQDIGGRKKEKEATLEDLMQDVGLKQQDFNFSDGEFYYEYWYWVCYFARKKKNKEASA